jgi:hypothetical protein
MAAIDLQPNDRICFGTGSMFLYKNRDRGSESMSDDPEISFTFAMQEKRVLEDADAAVKKAADAKLLEAET